MRFTTYIIISILLLVSLLTFQTFDASAFRSGSLGYTCNSTTAQCTCTTVSDCDKLKSSGECKAGTFDPTTNACTYHTSSFKGNSNLNKIIHQNGTLTLQK
jgi:hypothetical protein